MDLESVWKNKKQKNSRFIFKAYVILICWFEGFLFSEVSKLGNYPLGGKIDNTFYFLNDYGLSFHISDCQKLKSQIIFGLGQVRRNTYSTTVWIMCWYNGNAYLLT